MSDEQLQRLVEKISLESFGQPFCHRAFFNKRLKATGGRYHLNDHHLDFNPTIVKDHGLEVFVGIIKHELCHYHLHLAKKGYRHRDKDFKLLLAQTGGSRYAPQRIPEPAYTYQCQNCNKLFQRQRKINTKKYVCGNCKGPLILKQP